MIIICIHIKYYIFTIKCIYTFMFYFLMIKLTNNSNYYYLFYFLIILITKNIQI